MITYNINTTVIDWEYATGDWRDDMIVSYMKMFRSFHPVNSKVNNIHVTEGYRLSVYHYCPGAFYCVLKTDDKPVLARIYNL